MGKLEDLKRGALVKGLHPIEQVEILDVKWHGSDVMEVTYRDSKGNPTTELIYRDRESSLNVVERGRAWSFDADGNILRLVSEAYRINLAHLFDPLLGVHTSLLEPLPHQITAVYGELIPRQPLRFLLADDPGAGKTIMAGLLIKELFIRGDIRRCLICCPGNLAEQWQDELWARFHFDFRIISNQTIQDSRSGNPYAEYGLVISRLDHMSRNPEIQARLEQTEWDMVVIDEAHKMSAHFYGQEIKETKRYRLGKLLGAPERTRNLLLMTATPHNGKEEDFQLFMALLDGDRFEGKFRDGVHTADTNDLMRRLVKEQLVRFDGTPLFPERHAYTTKYELSPLEAKLYSAVTTYVQEEMNRADKLTAEGEGRRGNRVGFALTVLQRRLASSPEAIFQSLKRRRERLESRLREFKIVQRGITEINNESQPQAQFDDEFIEEMDDTPSSEVESIEEEVIAQASAARTIAELEMEITTLERLEELGKEVVQSGTDRKWEELSNLLQNTPEMFDETGSRRKLIIFTEHRDTLNYLAQRIRALLGRPEVVVTIHGSMGREERKKIQESFTQDKDVHILVATDAAGEGINLQRAHLMVNYDLPWNPNRLEQRFGRIHRIGQTEVCHMWSIVAYETREGDVFLRLLEKLQTEREALGGGVFDVLGRVFEGTELRKLLIEAIRYGAREDVKLKLRTVVDRALDRERLRSLIEERALTHDILDTARVQSIREVMERAEARRLQPYFIRSFFLEAFKFLGGAIHEREPNRYEITHVPVSIRNRDRQIGIGQPILTKYERVCFEKDQITVPGKPLAAFICPGQPLLDATTDLLLERHREVLKKGAVLIDPTDHSNRLRVLFYLEHSLQDARVTRNGKRRVISQQLQFIEMDSQMVVRSAGYAPYLDYRPITEDERNSIRAHLNSNWLKQDLEPAILAYAAEKVVPAHLSEVKNRTDQRVARTISAVKDRLTKEINYWDHRANELKRQELAGKPNAKLNSGKARQRADELQARLTQRLAELELERQISASLPIVVGGCLVVPIGLIELERNSVVADPVLYAKETVHSEKLAIEKVMDCERSQGRLPIDVSAEKRGYDIESSILGTGRLLFIEVKGRVKDATTVTITKNEILTGLNKPEEFILAIVPIEYGQATDPIYIKKPFRREPDFGVTSVNYNLTELLSRGSST